MAKHTEDLTMRIGAKDKASGTFKRIQGSIAKMAVGFLALSTVTMAFKAVIAAGRETTKVYTDLAGAVERSGQVWSVHEAMLRSYTDKMQTATGVSDELYAASVGLLLDYGMKMPGALKAVGQAADLAAARNISLVTAVDLVGKAFVGYTGTLSRYGIIVDANLSETEKFIDAMKQMESFAGAAAKRMESMDGKLKLLGERFGDAQEKIGLFLLRAGEPLLDWMLGIEDKQPISHRYMEAIRELTELRLKGSGMFLHSGVEVGAEAAQERILHLERFIKAVELMGVQFHTYDQGVIGPFSETIEKAADEMERLSDATLNLLSLAPATGEYWGNRAAGSATGGASGVGYEDWFDMQNERWERDVEYNRARTEGDEEVFENMTATQQTFTDATMSSFGILGSGFNEMLWGMETSWEDTLKRMAMNFTGILINSVMTYASGGLLGALGMPGFGGNAKATARMVAPELERMSRDGFTKLRTA